LKISLAMIVKDEEKYIQRCLNSVIGLVDEIVIVDTGSTDNTINIVKQFRSISLFNFNWCDDFSKARNFSIEKTTGDYVLVLDADEFIINGTRSELESTMQRDSIGKILIDSHFKKENQEYHAKAYVSRFFPKSIRYVGAIHEQLDSDKPRVNLNLTVKHDGYFETNKSERNIPLLLKEVKRNPADPYYLFQLGKELRISKRYEQSFHFLKKAYELSNLSVPFYEEIILELINSGKECGKEELFEVINQNEGALKNVSDFHFAKGLFYLDYCLRNPNEMGNLIKGIENSFLTCLRLNDKFHTEYVQGTSSYLAAYNLGVFYEVTSDLKKAIDYYEMSYEYGYRLGKKRLELLKQN
jgi:glycosyltransferase involved in cell wall biosynthesis